MFFKKLWNKLTNRDELAELRLKVKWLQGPLHGTKFKDKDGEMCILYHATPAEDFDVEIDGWRYQVSKPWYHQGPLHRLERPAIEYPRPLDNP